MEPMNLGSSPSSPSANPNFLPSFLMGENQPIATPSNTAVSPGRNRTHVMMYQHAMRQKLLFNQSNATELNASTHSPFRSPAMEKSGPPKQGLFDSMDNAGPVLSSTMKHCNDPASSSMNESTMYDAYCPPLSMPTGSESVYYNDSQVNYRPMSSSVPLNHINTLWVTVFGFVPSSTSLILAQLANCGAIQEKIFPTQGNWVHLKYCTSQEVAKALLLNGKLISNSIMIGVVQYYNKSEADKENMNVSGAFAPYTSPIRARSLRTSGIPTPNANVVVSPQNVPQKSTGLVTKAMEYMFGW